MPSTGSLPTPSLEAMLWFTSFISRMRRPEAVSITPRKLQNRRTKSDDMLGRIAAGWFPPEPDPVTCPRCPHFFICPSRPQGPLTLP